MAADLKEIELEQQALTVADEAKAIVIRDQHTHDLAAEKLIGIRELIKQINNTFDPHIKAANDEHKKLIATKKKVLGVLPDADSILVKAISHWEWEQDRLRREAQERAMAEARKREEEERLKLAEIAQKQGASAETVDEILETPMPVQAPIVAPAFQRTAGLSAPRKPVYRWRVLDESRIPRTYLKIDEPKINGVVRAMGAATKIDGIEIYEDIPNVAVRTARR